MTVPKSLCLYLYLGLLVCAWLVLFVRALALHKLVVTAAPLFLHGERGTDWVRAGSWRVVADLRRLRLLRVNIDMLPLPLREQYRRFVVLHRAALVLVALVVLLALVAHRICG